MNSSELQASKSRDGTLKAALLVSSCYAIWGVSPIFWKQLTSHINSLYIMCVRVVFSMLVCGILILLLKKTALVKAALSVKKNRILLPVSGFMIAANWGFFILSVSTGRIIEGSLAYFLTPIFSVAIGFIFLHEKLTRLQWAAVAIACLGVGVTLAAYGRFPYIALLIAAPYMVYSTVKKLTDLDSISALFLETLSVSPFALAVMIYFEIKGQGALANLSGAQFLLLPAAGAVTAVPLIFLSLGLHSIKYSLAGILTYINPCMQIIISLTVYGETIKDYVAMTLCFVIVALALYTAGVFVGGRVRRE